MNNNATQILHQTTSIYFFYKETKQTVNSRFHTSNNCIDPQPHCVAMVNKICNKIGN